jgi:hypothetical protein
VLRDHRGAAAPERSRRARASRPTRCGRRPCSP